MVEWYPHVLVVSSIVPRGPEACSNVIEFYYPEDIVLFEREFVAAEQAAYSETAVEDAEICDRMTAGRRALHRQGINETGPYQSPMEDGLLHFHEFLRRELETELRARAEWSRSLIRRAATMMFTTLVSPAQLAAHIADPQWIVFDCRFDLADTERRPPRLFAITYPWRPLCASRRGPGRTQDRCQWPSPAARSG